MAKLPANSPIKFRGKLSNIVICEWNGIYIAKAAPHWKKKYKATPKQKANQEKFRFANSIIGVFRPLLDLTVQKEIGQTRASSIMKELLHNAMIGPWPDTYVDYSKLMLAKGTLPVADTPVAKAGEGGRIDFAWEYNWRNYPKNKDHGKHYAMLIAFSENAKYPSYEVHGSMRQQREGSLQTRYKKGEEVHTWIAFRSSDFGWKSNSIYTGKVKIK